MNIVIRAYRMRVGLFGCYQQRTKYLEHLNYFELVCWLSMILLTAGDVHQNPSTTSLFSTTSTADCLSLTDSCLKVVNYSVQSFFGIL